MSVSVFRGTPAGVQSIVISAFSISIDRTLAAVFIVSISTRAYMVNRFRGSIFAE